MPGDIRNVRYFIVLVYKGEYYITHRLIPPTELIQSETGEYAF